MRTITFDTFVRGLVFCGLAAVAILLVNYLSGVLLPFFVAWLLAYLIYPVVTFFQYRLHVPGRALSIIVSLLVIIAAIALVLWLILPPMFEQFERLGALLGEYLQRVTNVDDMSGAILQWLKENREEIERVLQSDDAKEAMRRVVPGVFFMVGRTFKMIFGLVAVFMTLLYMFFILLDYEKLCEYFIRLFPQHRRPFWQSLINDVDASLNSYVRGQSLVALCIGVLFCIGFTLIGFPMAIGMGIMIGVMSLVPYVHSLALIPIVLLSALKAAETGSNFWLVLFSALAVFAVIQVITDMVLTPKIMGKAMGLNPAILLLSLSVWGSLLGFVGLIVALPLTTILIAYYKRYVTKE